MIRRAGCGTLRLLRTQAVLSGNHAAAPPVAVPQGVLGAEGRDMSGKGYLMVRAVLADAADRPRFDRWYETEHLPDALKSFGAERAWRCWSRTDPAVHYALYEFADVARAEAILESSELRRLVEEFDRTWGSRVTRTREILEAAGTPAARA